jgi:hypothetical protein
LRLMLHNRHCPAFGTAFPRFKRDAACLLRDLMLCQIPFPHTTGMAAHRHAHGVRHRLAARGATRCANVLVLREPAPATTRSGRGGAAPTSCSTAARCSVFRLAKRSETARVAVSTVAMAADMDELKTIWLNCTFVQYPGARGIASPRLHDVVKPH